jgi:hypothetical protein
MNRDVIDLNIVDDEILELMRRSNCGDTVGPTMKLIRLARAGRREADAALRRMILECYHRNQKMTTLLAAYNIEILDDETLAREHAREQSRRRSCQRRKMTKRKRRLVPRAPQSPA